MWPRDDGRKGGALWGKEVGSLVELARWWVTFPSVSASKLLGTWSLLSGCRAMRFSKDLCWSPYLEFASLIMDGADLMRLMVLFCWKSPAAAHLTGKILLPLPGTYMQMPGLQFSFEKSYPGWHTLPKHHLFGEAWPQNMVRLIISYPCNPWLLYSTSFFNFFLQSQLSSLLGIKKKKKVK